MKSLKKSIQELIEKDEVNIYVKSQSVNMIDNSAQITFNIKFSHNMSDSMMLLGELALHPDNLS
ncbi:hypothetical protein B0191_12285 [Leptospira interrogans serovar Hardjo]|nr:hypothetical protein B0191_12285 [Leptospira interrogans serovar Hardjo]